MILSDLVRAVIALVLHLRHPLGTHLAALPAERHADVRLAVFHQRPRLDSCRPSPPATSCTPPIRSRSSRSGPPWPSDLFSAASRSSAAITWRSPSMRSRSCFRPPASGSFASPAASTPGVRNARRPAPDADAREPLTEDRIVRPWHEYIEGLRYMRATPLIFGIGLISVGWATGGGAAQILLSLFGDVVFQRGSIGIGAMWGSAGIGLIIGAIVAHRIFPRLSYSAYKLTISICYILHGLFFLLFSLSPSFAAAILLYRHVSRRGRRQLGVQFIAASAPRRTRISRTRLLHHRNLDLDDDDGFDERGRLGLRSRQSARHRSGCRDLQHVDRVLVGLGQLRRQTAGAGSGRSRPR